MSLQSSFKKGEFPNPKSMKIENVEKLLSEPRTINEQFRGIISTSSSQENLEFNSKTKRILNHQHIDNDPTGSMASPRQLYKRLRAISSAKNESENNSRYVAVSNPADEASSNLARTKSGSLLDKIHLAHAKSITSVSTSIYPVIPKEVVPDRDPLEDATRQSEISIDSQIHKEPNKFQKLESIKPIAEALQSKDSLAYISANQNNNSTGNQKLENSPLEKSESRSTSTLVQNQGLDLIPKKNSLSFASSSNIYKLHLQSNIDQDVRSQGSQPSLDDSEMKSRSIELSLPNLNASTLSNPEKPILDADALNTELASTNNQETKLISQSIPGKSSIRNTNAFDLMFPDQRKLLHASTANIAAHAQKEKNQVVPVYHSKELSLDDLVRTVEEQLPPTRTSVIAKVPEKLVATTPALDMALTLEKVEDISDFLTRESDNVFAQLKADSRQKSSSLYNVLFSESNQASSNYIQLSPIKFRPPKESPSVAVPQSELSIDDIDHIELDLKPVHTNLLPERHSITVQSPLIQTDQNNGSLNLAIDGIDDLSDLISRESALISSQNSPIQSNLKKSASNFNLIFSSLEKSSSLLQLSPVKYVAPKPDVASSQVSSDSELSLDDLESLGIGLDIPPLRLPAVSTPIANMEPTVNTVVNTLPSSISKDNSDFSAKKSISAFNILFPELDQPPTGLQPTASSIMRRESESDQNLIIESKEIQVERVKEDVQHKPEKSLPLNNAAVNTHSHGQISLDKINSEIVKEVDFKPVVKNEIIVAAEIDNSTTNFNPESEKEAEKIPNSTDLNHEQTELQQSLMNNKKKFPSVQFLQLNKSTEFLASASSHLHPVSPVKPIETTEVLTSRESTASIELGDESDLFLENRPFYVDAPLHDTDNPQSISQSRNEIKNSQASVSSEYLSALGSPSYSSKTQANNSSNNSHEPVSETLVLDNMKLLQKELEEQIRYHRNDKKASNKQLMHLNRVLLKKQDQLELLKRLNARKEVEIQSLKYHLSRAGVDTDALEEERKLRVKELSTLELEIKQLKKEVEKTNLDYQEAKYQSEHMTRQYLSASNLISIREKEIESLKTNIANYVELLNQHQTDNEAIGDLVGLILKRFPTGADLNMPTKEKLVCLKTFVAEKDEEMQQQLMNETLKVKNLTNEITTLKGLQAQISSKLDEKNAENSESKEYYMSRILELKEEVVRQRVENEKLTKSKQDADQLNDSLKQQLSSEKAQVFQIESEMKNLKSAMNATELENKKLYADIEGLHLEISKQEMMSKKEKEDIQVPLSLIEKEVLELTESLNAQISISSNYKEQAEISHGKLSQATTEISELKLRLDQYSILKEKEIVSLRQELADNASEIKIYKEDTEKLKEDLYSKTFELEKYTMKVEIENTTRKRTESVNLEKLQAANRQLEKEKMELIAEVSVMEFSIKELQEQVDLKDSSRSQENKSIIESYQLEISQLSTTLLSNDRQILELQNELDAAKSTAEFEKSQSSQFKSELDKLTTIHAKAKISSEKAIRDLKHASDLQLSRLEFSQKEIDMLKSDLNKSINQCASISGQLSLALSKNKEVTEKLRVISEESNEKIISFEIEAKSNAANYQSLKKEHELYKSKMEIQSKKLSTTMATLQKSLINLENENVRLKDSKQALINPIQSTFEPETAAQDFNFNELKLELEAKLSDNIKMENMIKSLKEGLHNQVMINQEFERELLLLQQENWDLNAQVDFNRIFQSDLISDMKDRVSFLNSVNDGRNRHEKLVKNTKIPIISAAWFEPNRHTRDTANTLKLEEYQFSMIAQKDIAIRELKCSLKESQQKLLMKSSLMKALLATIDELQKKLQDHSTYERKVSILDQKLNKLSMLQERQNMYSEATALATPKGKLGLYFAQMHNEIQDLERKNQSLLSELDAKRKTIDQLEILAKDVTELLYELDNPSTSEVLNSLSEKVKSSVCILETEKQKESSQIYNEVDISNQQPSPFLLKIDDYEIEGEKDLNSALQENKFLENEVEELSKSIEVMKSVQNQLQSEKEQLIMTVSKLSEQMHGLKKENERNTVDMQKSDGVIYDWVEISKQLEEREELLKRERRRIENIIQEMMNISQYPSGISESIKQSIISLQSDWNKQREYVELIKSGNEASASSLKNITADTQETFKLSYPVAYLNVCFTLENAKLKLQCYEGEIAALKDKLGKLENLNGTNTKQTIQRRLSLALPGDGLPRSPVSGAPKLQSRRPSLPVPNQEKPERSVSLYNSPKSASIRTSLKPTQFSSVNVLNQEAKQNDSTRRYSTLSIPDMSLANNDLQLNRRRSISAGISIPSSSSNRQLAAASNTAQTVNLQEITENVQHISRRSSISNRQSVSVPPKNESLPSRKPSIVLEVQPNDAAQTVNLEITQKFPSRRSSINNQELKASSRQLSMKSINPAESKNSLLLKSPSIGIESIREADTGSDHKENELIQLLDDVKAALLKISTRLGYKTHQNQSLLTIIENIDREYDLICQKFSQSESRYDESVKLLKSSAIDREFLLNKVSELKDQLQHDRETIPDAEISRQKFQTSKSPSPMLSEHRKSLVARDKSKSDLKIKDQNSEGQQNNNQDQSEPKSPQTLEATKRADERLSTRSISQKADASKDITNNMTNNKESGHDYNEIRIISQKLEASLLAQASLETKLLHLTNQLSLIKSDQSQYQSQLLSMESLASSTNLSRKLEKIMGRQKPKVVEYYRITTPESESAISTSDLSEYTAPMSRRQKLKYLMDASVELRKKYH